MSRYRERLFPATQDKILEEIRKFMEYPTIYAGCDLNGCEIREVPMSSPSISCLKSGRCSVFISDPLLGKTSIEINAGVIFELNNDNINIYEIDDRMVGLTSCGKIIDNHLAFRIMSFRRVKSISDKDITDALSKVMIDEYGRVQKNIERAISYTEKDIAGEINNSRRPSWISNSISKQIQSKFNWKFSDTNMPLHIDVVSFGLPGDLTLEFDYHEYIANANKINDYGLPLTFSIIDSLTYKYIDNCNDLVMTDVIKFITRLGEIYVMNKK